MRPRLWTATQRKDARRRVRNALGPHSSDAPDMRAIVSAYRSMRDLVHLSTDGELRLALIDCRTGEEMSASEITFAGRDSA